MTGTPWAELLLGQRQYREGDMRGIWVRRNPVEIGVYLLAFLTYKLSIVGLALACWVWLLDIIKGG